MAITLFERRRNSKKGIETWNIVDIAADIDPIGLKRRFNPPSAPYQGSIFVRVVSRIKRLLYIILGTRCLTDVVLQTNFCLVQHAPNSLPPTPVCTDFTNLITITRNHFPLGKYSTSIPSVGVNNESDHRKSYAHTLIGSSPVGLVSTYRR